MMNNERSHLLSPNYQIIKSMNHQTTNYYVSSGSI